MSKPPRQPGPLMTQPVQYRAASLALPGVSHGFTSRHGGVSPAPRASLDLGTLQTTPEERRANWSIVLEDPEGPSRLALVQQVHGRGVHVAEAPGGPDVLLAQADAVVTATPGVVVAVRIADCVPILVASLGERPVVAAIHAGWRGVAADVVQATIAEIRRLDPRGRLVAAVGPRVSADRYPVGQDVIDGLRAAGIPDAAFLEDREGRPHVDLGRAVAHQLTREGVDAVELLSLCTSEPSFFSYRYDGADTGRQAAWISLNE
jgi:YfiH family protein